MISLFFFFFLGTRTMDQNSIGVHAQRQLKPTSYGLVSTASSTHDYSKSADDMVCACKMWSSGWKINYVEKNFFSLLQMQHINANLDLLSLSMGRDFNTLLFSIQWIILLTSFWINFRSFPLRRYFNTLLFAIQLIIFPFIFFTFYILRSFRISFRSFPLRTHSKERKFPILCFNKLEEYLYHLVHNKNLH